MLTDYQFTKGKSLSDCNVYYFVNSKNENDKIFISQLRQEFEQSDSSNYLRLDFELNGEYERTIYIDRKSDEYQELSNISRIIENYGGIVKVCSGCHTITLAENITNANDSKCIYCDLYVCKKCKKMKPLAELDDNRLCEKCREV